MVKRKHPIQKVHIDSDGVERFVQNKIVRYLMTNYAAQGGLNEIYEKFHDEDEDYEQLMMLIGYSLGGMCDLGYTKTVRTADRRKTSIHKK